MRAFLVWGLAACVSTSQASGAAAVATAWQQLDDGDPSPAWAFGAYDSARQLPVLVDDGLGVPDGPAIYWELSGSDWRRRRFTEPTPHRILGCVAYDAGRGRLVVFGEGASSDRTWEFDGTNWVERVLAVHPPGRRDCAMAYDSANGRIVVFGGYSIGFSGLSDTWEYDGTAWQQIVVAGPSPRGQSGMAFDSSRGVSVLMGGRQGNTLYPDIWEYDARRDRWRQKSPATGPSARTAPGMAFDPVRSRTVLFGGLTYPGPVNDTWEWDGTAWTQRATSAAPSPRFHMVTMYDVSRGAVVGWGGSVDNFDFNDSWAYDGSNWTQIAVSGLPQVRTDFALAYSPVTDGLVLYGGQQYLYHAPLSDTWRYAGGTWIPESPTGLPTAFSHFHLQHDPVSGRLEGFGGSTSGGSPGPADQHDFDPTTVSWTSSAACCPDPRTLHGWVRAESLGGTVMFGGFACCVLSSGYYANDTWLATPTGWSEIGAPNPPNGRGEEALAWDSARNRAVLYGGHDFNVSYSDTWEFDGQSWTRVLAQSPPGERTSVDAVYDPIRQVTVLFGSGPVDEAVTWEWDGIAWTGRPTPTLPDPSRAYLQMAYDPKREVVMLFGGGDLKSSYVFNDTWAYGADPDGDGIVGRLDNCTGIANLAQANLDGDPAGDLCDCAPSDASSFAIPDAIAGLTLSGSSPTSLSWSDASPSAGSGTKYDVASGLVSTLRTGSYGGGTCVASQVAFLSVSDGRTPPPNDGYWYLVRGSNTCGRGTYGAASLDAAGPCP